MCKGWITLLDSIQDISLLVRLDRLSVLSIVILYHNVILWCPIPWWLTAVPSYLSDFDSTYRRTSRSYFDLFYFDLNVNLPFSFSFFFFWINCLLYFCVMLLTALIKWFQCFCLPVFKIEETMQESTKLLLNNWKVFENIFCAVDFGPRHWLTKTCFDFQRISEV